VFLADQHTEVILSQFVMLIRHYYTEAAKLLLHILVLRLLPQNSTSIIIRMHAFWMVFFKLTHQLHYYTIARHAYITCQTFAFIKD
jgi:hypothetical protein